MFLQRVNLWRISGVVRRYVMAPELGRMLCGLEGIDGIRVWHDQTLQKQPWANPTTWHADGPNWSFHSRHAVSIWIALDRATIPNGCLWFIPGSHHVTRFAPFPITENMDRVFGDYPELAGRQAEAVELAPGSAAVFNGMLVHGAGPNMTPGWRRAMNLRLHAGRRDLQRPAQHPYRRTDRPAPRRQPARRRRAESGGLVAHARAVDVIDLDRHPVPAPFRRNGVKIIG